jgi:hypothetical protein
VKNFIWKCYLSLFSPRNLVNFRRHCFESRFALILVGWTLIGFLGEKMTQKKRIEFYCFEVLDVSSRAEGFSLSCDVLYGGLN